MITRREWLGLTATAGAALAINPRLLRALQEEPMITRAVPSTGEQLPIVGLGSSDTFARLAREGDVSALRDVLRTLVDGGGSVFDTAPSYGGGDSEEVAGDLANELGIQDDIFWATKVNVAGRGGGSADPAEARAQIERSFDNLGVSEIDLIQVHNLGDVPTQLGILKELKAEGRIRYIGVTTTSENALGELERIMRSEPLDFVGIGYAVDNREVEPTILPLAMERQIGVLVYQPFGRTRLWARVEGQEVPEWAHEFDATSWAQFFIKYVASHPAVTAVTPTTSQPHHMADNLGGGRGRLPDEATRQRMVELVDALPPAPRRRR